ncbi:MAG: hypothetical protein HQ555_02340 [Candidatus Aminicenantes bacterium]|nr:hypothetical protein [Candidatus Aminicenantes bacterium]
MGIILSDEFQSMRGAFQEADQMYLFEEIETLISQSDFYSQETYILKEKLKNIESIEKENSELREKLKNIESIESEKSQSRMKKTKREITLKGAFGFFFSFFVALCFLLGIMSILNFLSRDYRSDLIDVILGIIFLAFWFWFIVTIERAWFKD